MKQFLKNTFKKARKKEKTWEYLRKKKDYYRFIERIRFQKTGGFKNDRKKIHYVD